MRLKKDYNVVNQMIGPFDLRPFSPFFMLKFCLKRQKSYLRTKYLKMKRACFLLVAMLAAAIQLSAGITLPSIISDNMVLQQKTDAKLWGWGEPGEKIEIRTSWGKKVYSAQADADGKWSVYVKTPGHCCGQWVKVSSGRTGETVEISNVLVGEVWMASGQSNMEFEMMPHKKDTWMTGMYNWEEEAADAEYPNIHLFKVEEDWDHNVVRDNCKGEWVVCSPEVAKTYSAIAFLFARELHKELRRPVGIVLCAFGGTHAESWIRDEVMRRDSIYNRVYKGYSPGMPVIDKYPHKAPAAIWNAMVNPILGYTVKGNIWYQAESNAWRAEDYAPIFIDLVNDWRSLWGQKRLPFYFMQVAPYGELPGAVRLEQAKVWENGLLKDIGMATAIDVGDSLDIHPKNKVVPAHRFALWALAKEYGKKVECCGPLLEKVSVEGNRMVLSFGHSKGLYVLNAAGEKVSAGVNYLYVAGTDGNFHPALSEIIGGKLHVWSPDVPAPAQVKYCTEDYCKGNLYNGAGLPAYPFVH